MIDLNVGDFIKKNYIDPLGITPADLARAVNASPAQVSRILSNKSDISPEMAMKLAKAFNKTPEYWMNIQQKVSLSRVAGMDVSDVKVLDL